MGTTSPAGVSADDDTTLIEAWRRGDDEALAALVERYRARVYRIALGVLPRADEAEEAAQESLLAAVGSLPRFRGESRFSTWLYRVTLNTCFKRRRRVSRRRESPLPETAAETLADPAALPDEVAARRRLRQRVAGFLAVLPEHYRVPVVLSDALDVPVAEVAELLGISLPAAKARVRRGRLRLRAEVERYCKEAGLSGWQELLEG